MCLAAVGKDLVGHVLAANSPNSLMVWGVSRRMRLEDDVEVAETMCHPFSAT